MPLREILGHRLALGLLARSIQGGTLPPSLIFSGPEGVGKRLVAQGIAQALNCLTPVQGGELAVDACGECAACRRIARGVYPDVFIIEPGPSGAIKIETVRDAIDTTMYRPFEGKRRVAIVDDAEALVPAAQNALLKTLEEPPTTSIYILVTSRPDSLLPTVRSRCSQIRFGRLAASDVAAILERHHKYSRRDAMAVAANADGSAGHALNTQAEEFADARAAAEELLKDSRTRGDARTRLERARDLVKGTGSASEREYLGVRLQALASLTRDLGILASGADASLLANADLRTELESLVRHFDGERTVHLFGAINRAQDALERNVSPKVVADWLAIQL